MAVGHRVVNAVMGAFAAALPDRVPAAYYRVSYAYALNAARADGFRQVYFDLECGGWGAHPREDGASAFSRGFHNLANAPIEMIENTYPVTFMEYGLRPDSGAAGRHRGGLGLARELRFDAPAGTFDANLDRFEVPPYGLAGGGPGAPGKLEIKRAGSAAWEPLSSKVSGLEIRREDRVRLETSGEGATAIRASATGRRCAATSAKGT